MSTRIQGQYTHVYAPPASLVEANTLQIFVTGTGQISGVQ